jgi:hypothetical protein
MFSQIIQSVIWVQTLALNSRNAGTLVLSTRLAPSHLHCSLADAKQADTDESAGAGLRSPAGVNVVRFDQSASDFK